MLCRVKQEKKKKAASQPFASLTEQVLSELREIRAEMTTLQQEVYYKKSASAKTSGNTPAYKKIRCGCKVCHDRGEADSYMQCWKCGDATHFAYNCP